MEGSKGQSEGRGLSEGSEGQLEGSEVRSDGSEGKLEKSDDQPEGSKPDGSPGRVRCPVE